MRKILFAGLIAGITTMPVQAAVTLLDENFNAGLPASALTLGGSSTNLRLGTDSINTYNAGNPLQRFALAAGSNFFLPATADNQFVVMGDTSGQLAGSPTSGTFGIALPFALAAGTSDITVSFDWVFSAFALPASATGDTDQFSVGVIGNGFDINNPLANTASVLSQSITTSGKAYGPTNVNIPVNSLGAADANGNYWLSFGYFENTTSITNGAVGIDNIKITANVSAVPVPAAVWLFGSAMLGFIGIGRRSGVNAA